MRILWVVLTAFVLAFCISSPKSSADDNGATEHKHVTNQLCPLMGDEVNPKLRVEYEGQYVYFCCSGCIDMFKADPAAAMAKLTESDRAAVAKNSVCPMSGEKIESFDVRIEFEGRLIYFCCPHCKGEFAKSHPGAQ